MKSHRLNLRNDAIAAITNDANGYSSLSVTGEGSVVAVQRARTSSIWILEATSPARAQRSTPVGSQYFGVSWLNNNHDTDKSQCRGRPENLVDDSGWFIYPTLERRQRGAAVPAQLRG